MTMTFGSTVLLDAMLAVPPMLPAAGADSLTTMRKVAYGTIVGTVTNSAKLPVAGATVTAIRVDGSAIRSTVAGSDGVYSFADLAPGAWSITAQREGASDVVVPAVEVVAGKASRNDLVMATGPAVATTASW